MRWLAVLLVVLSGCVAAPQSSPGDADQIAAEVLHLYQTMHNIKVGIGAIDASSNVVAPAPVTPDPVPIPAPNPVSTPGLPTGPTSKG